MEHYHCVKCYIPATHCEHDVDTLEFFPNQIPFLAIATKDYLKEAALDILSILRSKPTTLPTLEYGDNTKNALVQIARLLGRATKPPPELKPEPQLPRVVVENANPAPNISPTISPPATSPQKLHFSMPTRARASLPRVHWNLCQSKHPMSLRFCPATNQQPAELQWQSLQHIQALQTFQLHAHHIFNEHGVKETINTLLHGKDGKIWNTSLNNKSGRRTSCTRLRQNHPHGHN
jgi:hypothetical protein